LLQVVAVCCSVLLQCVAVEPRSADAYQARTTCINGLPLFCSQRQVCQKERDREKEREKDMIHRASD